jgi:hypothetical protein
MRLMKILAIVVIALASLSSLILADPDRTLDEVAACSQKDDAIKEYPAACYVAVVLKKIEGKSAADALKIVEDAAKNIPPAAALARSALDNIANKLRSKILQDERDALVKSPKEAEDFLDACNKKGSVPDCAAAVARLLELASLEPPFNGENLLKVLGGAKVDVSEVPSGANEDIQLVAGAALAVTIPPFSGILSPSVGFPDGIIKYDKIPGVPGDETGLIVSGKTAYARAAGSDIARGKTVHDWIPPRGIDARKTKAIYDRLVKAEEGGKMELADLLARVYINILRGNIVDRGLEEAVKLSDACLTGQDIVLGGEKFECSKHKSLRLAMANEFQPGFLRFFGNLAGVSCEDLLKRAETGATAGIRLAGARAYVSGQVINIPGAGGIERKCIEPYTKASLLKLIREAKSAELRAEAAGDLWMAFNDGKAIGVYLAPRGLAALLLETGDADETLLNDSVPEIRQAAWLAVGLSWAKSKSRAANWGEATTGKNEARRRAGAFAYFFPRGLDQFRTFMEPLAQGDKVSVDKYTLDGSKAPLRAGAGLEAISVFAKRPEADLEKCADTGATPELKATCVEALAQVLANKPVSDLINQTGTGSAGRSKAAGSALVRALVGPPGLGEQEIQRLVISYSISYTRTDGFSVKDPLTAALVESFGTRIKESIK